MKFKLVYAREGDCYPLTAIPGMHLDGAFWREEQDVLEVSDERSAFWHLAVQEVRRCRGLLLDWQQPLMLECAEEYNPVMPYAFKEDLPSANLELALMGRLGDWKLLLLEFYSDELWAHFYNPVRLEWQTGVLLQKSKNVGARMLPPDSMYVYLPNGEWVDATYKEIRNGDHMAYISEFVAEARSPYRMTTVGDIAHNGGPVVKTCEYFYGEDTVERLKKVFVEE